MACSLHVQSFLFHLKLLCQTFHRFRRCRLVVRILAFPSPVCMIGLYEPLHSQVAATGTVALLVRRRSPGRPRLVTVAIFLRIYRF